MTRYLLTVLVLAGMVSTAQAQSDTAQNVSQPDTVLQMLSSKVIDISNKVESINLHLDKAHKQYRTGTVLIAAGLILNGVSVLMDPDQPKGAVGGLGGLLVLTGGIIHIDSHKFIGRTRRHVGYSQMQWF